MRFIVKLLFLLMVLLVFIGQAQAVTNCTDLGSDGIQDGIVFKGSSYNCTSIQWAIDNTTSGTVKLQAENHTITSTIDIISKSNITITGETTTREDTAILFETYPTFDTFNLKDSDNITIKNLYIYSTDTGTRDGRGFWFNHTDSVLISNVRVQNLESPLRMFATGYTFAPDGSANSNLTIENSRFNLLTSGMFFHWTEGSIIKNNEIGNTSAWFAVDFNTGNRNNIIENNTIYGAANSGIKVYSNNDNITFRDNIVYDNNNYGILVYQGADLINVTNNTVYNNDYSGIAVASYGNLGASNLSRIKNNKIYNNTLHGVYIGIQGDLPYGGGEMISYVDSNTIAYNGEDGIHLDYPGFWVNTTNNIIYENLGYGINASQSTLNSSYDNVLNNTLGLFTGLVSAENNLSIEPLFNDTSLKDFHLKSQAGRWNGSAWVTDVVTSSAIDAGDPASDYSNEPSPNGSRINLGAYGNTIYASKSGVGQVTGLTNGTVSNSTINVSWDTVPTSSWYEIFLDFLHHDYVQNTFYNFTGLVSNTLYSIQVRANDTLNNWGANSSILNVTTSSSQSQSSTTPTFSYGYDCTNWDNSTSENTTEDNGDCSIKTGVFRDNFNDGTENWGIDGGSDGVTNGYYYLTATGSTTRLAYNGNGTLLKNYTLYANFSFDDLTGTSMSGVGVRNTIYGKILYNYWINSGYFAHENWDTYIWKATPPNYNIALTEFVWYPVIIRAVGDNITFWINGIQTGTGGYNQSGGFNTSGNLTLRARYSTTYVDDIYALWTDDDVGIKTSGNLTTPYDAGFEKTITHIRINFTNSTNTSVDSYLSIDDISYTLLESNVTNATWISVPAELQNQTVYLRLVLKGTINETPAVQKFSFGYYDLYPNPTINSWGNNLTDNSNLSIDSNLSEVINFNATSSNASATWNWFKDGVDQNNNFNNLTVSWNTLGLKSIVLNITDFNGTSDSITWKIFINGSRYPNATSWEECTPESQNMNASKVQTFLNNAHGTNGNLVIIRNGCLIGKIGNYNTAGDYSSASKPVGAILTLFALKNGNITSINESIGAMVNKTTSSSLIAKDLTMSWYHLINMLSGYTHANVPGTSFAYNDYAIELLFVALMNGSFDGVNGTSPDTLAKSDSRLGPLNLQGNFIGSPTKYYRVYTSPSNYARIGLFVLNRFDWNGTQLLPIQYYDDYVKMSIPYDTPRSTRLQNDYLNVGTYGSSFSGSGDDQDAYLPGCYGFLSWWNTPCQNRGVNWPDAPSDMIQFAGHGGEDVVIILPSQNMVISGQSTTLGSSPNIGENSSMNQNLAMLISGIFEEQNYTNQDFIPPSPINLNYINITGGFNFTWDYGTIGGNITDSTYILLNGTWTNATIDRFMVCTPYGSGYCNITIYPYNMSGNGTFGDPVNLNITLIDTTPPASITNLANVTNATAVNWTWTDPADLDFDYVEIWLNGTRKTNVSKGAQYYFNGTLQPATEYIISTRTVDATGNINQTWVNQTTVTSSLPEATVFKKITRIIIID